MGRDTALTPERETEILKLAQAGVPQVVIADRTKIAAGTLNKWLKWGSDWEPKEGDECPADREPYRAFREAFRHAQSTPVVVCEATWMTAVQGKAATYDKDGNLLTAAVAADPKAAERWLKLHRPDLYREAHDVNLGGDLAKAVDGWAASIQAMIDQHATNTAEAE